MVRKQGCCCFETFLACCASSLCVCVQFSIIITSHDITIADVTLAWYVRPHPFPVPSTDKLRGHTHHMPPCCKDPGPDKHPRWHPIPGHIIYLHKQIRLIKIGNAKKNM